MDYEEKMADGVNAMLAKAHHICFIDAHGYLTIKAATKVYLTNKDVNLLYSLITGTNTIVKYPIASLLRTITLPYARTKSFKIEDRNITSLGSSYRYGLILTQLDVGEFLLLAERISGVDSGQYYNVCAMGMLSELKYTLLEDIKSLFGLNKDYYLIEK